MIRAMPVRAMASTSQGIGMTSPVFGFVLDVAALFAP
jgi:hypothetical protein